MNMPRLFTSLLLLIAVLIFFTIGQDDLDENGKWGLVGGIIILAMIWVVIGDKSKPVPVQVRNTSTVETSDELEDEMDLPEPVVKDELDGATLRERKLAKVKAMEEGEETVDLGIEEDDSIEDVEVTIEEVHVADEYVVEMSPQSIEDADIAASVRDRNVRHEKIRARIQERRRDQMAEIRASTARMWEEHSAGEDLVSLITSEDHQHNILEEPEVAKAGHAYGATLVRIDESTILKLRVPLDEGFVAIDESKSASTMPMPLPEGIPSPSDLGLPPLPPPPGASGALAALRDEIADN